MRIENLRKEPQTALQANDIPCGTVFQAHVAGTPGTFIRMGRVTCTIVSLNNAELYWSHCPTLSIRNYQPVHAHVVIERNA